MVVIVTNNTDDTQIHVYLRRDMIDRRQMLRSLHKKQLNISYAWTELNTRDGTFDDLTSFRIRFTRLASTAVVIMLSSNTF